MFDDHHRIHQSRFTSPYSTAGWFKYFGIFGVRIFFLYSSALSEKEKLHRL